MSKKESKPSNVKIKELKNLAKGGRKKKFTPEQVVNALTKSHGLKSVACELLACNFDTLQRYIAESKEAQETVDHWRKRRVDRAEFKLDEAIERGESWAITLILKGHKDGRRRGYGDNPVIQNVDLSALSEEQLGRLANGEDIVTVLLTTSGTSGTGAKTKEEEW